MRQILGSESIREFFDDYIKQEKITKAELSRRLNLTPSNLTHLLSKKENRDYCINTLTKYLEAIGYELYIKERKDNETVFQRMDRILDSYLL